MGAAIVVIGLAFALGGWTPLGLEGARLALQHNIGIGGACVVTLYGRE